MNALITKSLEEADITMLLQFPSELMDVIDTKRVKWIREYTNRYGEPPTLMRFSKEHDTFIAGLKGDPLGDLYDQAIVRYRNYYYRRYMREHEEDVAAGGDPTEHIAHLHSVFSKGASGVVTYTDFDRSRFTRAITAYPYGIPILDEKTGGASQGDLIYLFGRLGTGKTTFVLWCIKKWLEAGQKILVVSNENRAEDIIAKVDAFMGGWNPIKRRLMDWTEDEKTRIRTVSHLAEHLEGELYIPTDPVTNVDALQNLISTYQPDIVVIDGIYLLSDNKGDSAAWEKLTDVSRNLKRIADSQAVPIIGIHQANRSAIGRRVDVEHIAYSDALGQDADLVLGLNEEEDKELFIECLKNRWGMDRWGFFVKLYFESMTVRIMDPRYTMEDDDE